MLLMDEVTDAGRTSSWMISSENINMNFRGYEAKHVLSQSKPGSENQYMLQQCYDSSLAKLRFHSG